jgi:hypothetical protein
LMRSNQDLGCCNSMVLMGKGCLSTCIS